MMATIRTGNNLVAALLAAMVVILLTFPAGASSGHHEIIFIESDVQDARILLDGVPSGAEVVLLDASEDGMAQIAAALKGRSGITALHIVSHGSAAQLHLGATKLDVNNLKHYSSEVAVIRNALAGTADILLYGCSVAEGNSGEAFVRALSEATGATVAASVDKTGAPDKGGNALLEFSTGTVRSRVLAGLDHYAGSLVAITYTFDTSAQGWTGDLTSCYPCFFPIYDGQILCGSNAGSVNSYPPAARYIQTLDVRSYQTTGNHFTMNAFYLGSLVYSASIDRNQTSYATHTINKNVDRLQFVNQNTPGNGWIYPNIDNVVTQDAVVNSAPTVTGFATTTINDQQTATPFSTLTVADANGDNVSLTITYTAVNGTLSGTGLSGSAGSYAMNAAPAATIGSRLQALVFTPTPNQVAPGSSVTTTFTITPADPWVSGSSNSGSQVTATSFNNTPTAISISNNAIAGSAGVNAAVGTLSSTDADAGDSHTYALVTGTGDTNNALFNISGAVLRANDTTTMADGLYSVRIQTVDSQGAGYSQQMTINVFVYPPITINNPDDNLWAYITRVQIGTIDNSSTYTSLNNEGAYSDYTAQSTNLVRGSSQSISVSIGGTDVAGSTVAVFFDWNHDNDFADTNETVTVMAALGEPVSGASGGPYTATFSVPAGATPGPTRMRVIMDYLRDPIADCNLDYGEAEDYTVNVYIPPTVTSVSPSSGPTAGGTSVTITGTNLTGASAVTFGSTNASSYTVDSATQITATSPAGSAGTVDITVTTAGGTSAAGASDQFTYVAAPAVTTNAAGSVSSYGATLNGTVNARNQSTTVTFEYGMTNAYGTTVAADQNPVSGVSDTSVSKTITGLIPNTLYHYRVIAANAMGTTDGSDQTFTTSAVAPTITPGTPVVTSTTATITATINPHNSTTSITVDYGLTAGYGSSATTMPGSASGMSDTAVSSSLSGLLPNTTYHYRISAINGGGTATSGDMTFTTTAAAPIVTGVAPSSGPTAGGTSVTITGTNFTGATAVMFGTTIASGYTVNSATQITASSPAGSAGTVDITVTTAGGTSVTTSSDRFIYVAPPTVTSVSVPASGTYIAGQNLDFIVNFSQAVAVSTTGGTPYLQITLDTGGTVNAPYVSGSGTSALSFRYTVIGGNEDTNGIAFAGAITANGGTLRDAVGNDAVLTLNGVGSTTGVFVDAVVPAISISAPSAASTIAGPVSYTVTYSDTNFNTSTLASGHITLNKSGTADATTITVTGSGTTRTVTISGITGTGALGISIAAGTASDTAGNTAPAAGPSTTFVICAGNAITVANINDSGAGSLRQAVADSCPGGSIDFGVTGTITLTSGELAIDKDLTINGPGAADLTVSGGSTIRIFKVTGATSFTLQNLTLADGAGAGGGALIDNSTATTTITGCVFSGNMASISGGAIFAAGTMTISNTLFSGNSAAAGGAIDNRSATMTLTNITMNGNSATTFGGGILTGGTLDIVNATIAGNSAVQGGGIAVSGGTINLGNSIVSDNTATGGPDILGAVTSQGYNLIGTTADAAISGDMTGNIIGSNPLLGALADNGGPTQTMALLAGSPAINAAAGCPSTDQRGIARPQGASCDIGAYEFVTGTTITVGSSRHPSVFGQSVTFTATVSDSETGSAPTGAVTFKDGGVIIGTGALAGDPARATLALSSLAVGSHMITAEYSSDGSFVSSISPGINQIVTQAAATTTVASSANPSVHGQTVTFTTTVTSGSGTPTGIVTFMDGAVQLGTGILDGFGQAAFLTASLAVGGHSVAAVYGGDANNTSAASSVLTQTVSRAATATMIAADTPDPSMVDQAVAVSYTVTVNAPGSGIPTGNVTVSDGVSSCTGTVAAGSCSIIFMTSGARTLTATYAGDADFNGSTSTSVSHTVDNPTPPSFTLTVTKTGNGSGVVTGSTINCGTSCSDSFGEGTPVTLVASPDPGSVFTGWTGACTGTGICALTMNTDKGVTATFVRAIEAIDELYGFAYDRLKDPVLDTEPKTMRPIGLGAAAEGDDTLNIRVSLYPYVQPVDLYFIIHAPAIDPLNYYLLHPDSSLHPVTHGIVAWKEEVTGAVEESPFGAIKVSALPAGTYELYLMVTPAGRTDLYHLWQTALHVAMPGTITVPSGQQAFAQAPSAFPVFNDDPAQASPIGLGAVAVNGKETDVSDVVSRGDMLDLRIGLAAFSEPVDLYYVVHAPAIDPVNYYLLHPDGSLHPVSHGITPWRAGQSGVVDETLFREVPVSALPPGECHFYLIAMPAGSSETYYLWQSTISIP